MATGPYTDPSFLVRQNITLGRTTAGAAGTSIRYTFPSAVRIRRVTCGVVTAGTVAGAAAGIVIQDGTTALGTIGLSTNVAGVFGTTADLNYTLAAGGTLAIVNGTDATFVGLPGIEFHLDPAGSYAG